MSIRDSFREFFESSRRIDPAPEEANTHGDVERFRSTYAEDNWLANHHRDRELREERERQERELQARRALEQHRRDMERQAEMQRRRQEREENERQQAIREMMEAHERQERDRRRREMERREREVRGRFISAEELGRMPEGLTMNDMRRIWQAENGRTVTATTAQPRQYKFDFSKINSIEDMGKVLELLCTNHVMTEDYIQNNGISGLVKRVDDI
jgi:hypothetical protein